MWKKKLDVYSFLIFYRLWKFRQVYVLFRNVYIHKEWCRTLIVLFLHQTELTASNDSLKVNLLYLEMHLLMYEDKDTLQFYFDIWTF